VTARSARPGWMWSKLTTSKWEDAWVERLQCIGPERLAIFTLPGSRRIRIEAYGLAAREAAGLVTAFGGQTRRTGWSWCAPRRRQRRLRGLIPGVNC